MSEKHLITEADRFNDEYLAKKEENCLSSSSQAAMPVLSQ